MANRLEEIAEKKARKLKETRTKEIKSLSKLVANETLAGVKSLTDDNRRYLEGTIASLAKSIAETVALNNDKNAVGLSSKFKELTDAIKANKVDIPKNDESLAKKVAENLANFEKTLGSLELSPVIKLSAVTIGELKEEVNRILDALPKDSKRNVTIAYEKATASNYINVRLTDGISFYKALGGGGGGGGGNTPTIETEDGLAVPIANPDGTPIGGGSSSSIEYVKLIDETTTPDITYIGEALPTGSAIPTNGANWRIKKIDESGAVTSIKWADGETTLDKVWDNRVSLTYA